MNTAAQVARIGRRYPGPSTAAANDEDNKPTGSTVALALTLVLSPFVLLGVVYLIFR